MRPVLSMVEGYAIRYTQYEFIHVFAIPFRLKPHELLNGPNYYHYKEQLIEKCTPMG